MDQLDATRGKARRTSRKHAPQADERPLVLVVDDFAAARELYGRFLSYSGFRVEQAAGGPEALDKACALRPALVIMDLAMPGMDGWETIRRLRTDPLTRSCRIIVVTGAAYGGSAQKAKQAGCDAYLVKPCLPETLLDVVRRLLSPDRDA